MYHVMIRCDSFVFCAITTQQYLASHLAHGWTLLTSTDSLPEALAIEDEQTDWTALMIASEEGR